MKKKLIGISVAAFFLFSIYSYFVIMVDYPTITVTYKDGSKGKWMIFTKEETFEITDTMLFLRYRSSDLYGAFELGKTYKVKVYGIRFGYKSWYRNIISIKEEL